MIELVEMRPPRGQIGEKVSESEGLEHPESWPFGSQVLLLDMVALVIEILAVFNWDSLGLYCTCCSILHGSVH